MAVRGRGRGRVWRGVGAGAGLLVAAQSLHHHLVTLGQRLAQRGQRLLVAGGHVRDGAQHRHGLRAVVRILETEEACGGGAVEWCGGCS